ncbi:MaoC/PaaZ C-terminal domain-containing protein [Marmoricola sp. RAF53]|uniref:MaoC/PaaZ C-terminal domain-containing protein n=1 Tax=Marmoricola sp. RAF53 TaxID=3233059 RepID=UPI003F97D184
MTSATVSGSQSDRDRIDAFAETTEDRQWIHTDPDRAARGPFGTTIAHGYLIFACGAAAVVTPVGSLKWDGGEGPARPRQT